MPDYQICACIGPQGNSEKCPCAMRAEKNVAVIDFIKSVENIQPENQTNGTRQAEISV